MKKPLVLLLLFAVFLAPLSQAAETADLQESASSEAPLDEAVTEAVEQSTLLLQLKQKLAQAKYRYYILQNNIENAKEGLVDVHETILTLDDAIAHLDELIEESLKKIYSVNAQIEKKKMEIAEVEEEIQALELQVEDQKEVVGDLMTLLYVKRGVYYDGSNVNPIKVLASPQTVSRTLQKLTYLDLVEAENENQIVELKTLTETLQSKWDQLRTKIAELSKLDEELQGELKTLNAERDGKQKLLEETKGEELIYQNMLQAATEREEDILREIQIFEENVAIMEGKFQNLRETLSEDQQAIIDQIESEASQSFGVDEASQILQLDWPVSPERGLTAFFHDSGYQALFGVQHYALDIRAYHGSPIFAPADGVVYNVVFDEKSTRYGYVMIAHRMGVMTLFGHVSGVAVKPGDYVTRGQIIGLTGGTPGTPGAGVRTTGPHLHLEVWQDGVRVDPLKYLPLDQVPIDSLPQDYLEIIQNKLEEQIREIQSSLNL